MKVVLSPSIIAVALALSASTARSQDVVPSPRRVARVPSPSPDGGRECEPWPESGYELRVVHVGTVRPVPHARVCFQELSSHPGSERGWYTGTPHSAADPDRPERWFRADAEGRVVLPNRLASVVGTAPGLWGRGLVAPDLELERELELYPEEPMAVRVVDGKGEPVLHLPVELLLEQERTSGFFLRPGADGLARYSHVPYLAASRGMRRIAVGLAIPLAPPVEVEIDPTAIPREPVELVVPPLGALEIHLVDERGAVLASPARVQFWPAGTQPRFDPRHAASLGLPETRTRHVQAGHGSVREPVGLGLTLEVLVGAHGGFGPVHERIRGPTRVGEVIQHTLRLAPKTPFLTGLLVDERGAPLACTSFHLHLLDAFGQSTTSVAGEHFRTDAEGRFFKSLVFPRAVEQVAVLSFRTEIEERAPADLRVTLKTPLHPGENDLGVLATSRPPEVVSGTVVDEEGEPLRGAILFVSTQQAPGWDAGEEHWLIDHDLRCLTDAHGRFRVHARTQADFLQVSANCDSFSTEQRIRIRPPARDVVLVMGPGGGIAGKLRADEHVPAKAYRVAATREGGDPRIVYPVRAEAGGVFHVKGLPRGRYRLSIRHPFVDLELASFRGVEVRPGETNREPGLMDVDLRDLARKITLTALDEKGAVLADARALYRTRGELGASLYTLRASAEIVLVNGGEPVDVLVFAPERRALLLQGVSTTKTVALEPGIPVRFLFDGVAGSNAQDLQAKLSLISHDFPGQMDLRATPFGEAGEARILVPRAGTYQVSFSYQPPRPPQEARCGTGSFVKPPSIEILERTEEQVFRILPDAGKTRILPQ